MNLVSYKNAPVKVFYAEIGGSMEECVDARELHEFLEVGARFNDWIERRIEQLDLRDGIEFSSILSKTSEAGGRPKTEYAITVDTAKHLGMVEKNEKGKQLRDYFITVEKEAKKQISKLEQEAKTLEANKNMLLEELNKKSISEHKSKRAIRSLEEMALDERYKPETIDRLIKVSAMRNRGLSNKLIAKVLDLSVRQVEKVASTLISLGVIKPLVHSSRALMEHIGDEEMADAL